jgi:3'-phosphoadenosine 5'-phosphosulfate sulfotransferase (PAPS reductase)/FAD synthetase
MNVISWFSGGCTSAVACKLSVDKYKKDDLRIIYIETGSHHPDHQRFLADCEKWFDAKIEILRSEKYSDVFDVINKTRFINSPYGARCTNELKQKVRLSYEKNHPEITHQVWGFEFNPKEINRAKRLEAKYKDHEHLFPLIDSQITKPDALNMLKDANIAFPSMYLLGYNNSNCVGCVKGGMAYWNKIRVDFPEVFNTMAITERKINRSCLKTSFLDELDPSRGRGQPPLVSDCGSVGEGCEIELLKEYSMRE